MPARRLALVVVLLLAAPLARAAEDSERIPVHHQLSVRIDPARGQIDGTDRIRLLAPHPTSFTLASGLRVDSLVVDGAAVAVDAGAGRWALGFSGRDAHEIVVQYHGVIDAADRDEAGLLIDPAGAFLTGGDWYPTFDTGVRSYELAVEVPAGQLAVAPGRILAEEATDERLTARFASEGPMEEIALFAGPYRMSERRHHGRRLRTYFHAEVADLAASYLEKTARYLDLYEGWIGAYPYSTFHVVSGQRPLGLGFPGLTYIGAAVLRLPFLPETSLGHEVLHSWWGNAVLVDAEQGNWAEGLTTFMADYTYAERQGDTQARDMRRRWMREYAALPSAQDRPLTAFRSRTHTAAQVVGYHKAAMAFLMLRDEIGRDAFDRGIRRFWRRHRFRRAGWGELQRAFAATAGRSLEAFFSQWIERAGAPALDLRDAAVRSTGRSFVLSFGLAQPEPAYRLRVPLVIRSEHASTAEAVRFDAPSQRYDIRTAQRPHQLCLDPDFRLFRRPRPGEVPPILRSVVFDTEAPAVIAAGDPQARAAARALVLRLLEREPRFASADAALPEGPVAVVGTDADVEAMLVRHGVETPPALTGRGTARAWAAPRAGKGVLVAIVGRDATALSDTARALPHYGSESFVVFDGPRAIDRGVWPVDPTALCIELAGAEGR